MLELTRTSLVRVALTGSVVLSVIAPHQAGAQAAPAGFTVDDVLDVRNANVADVSRDGRWAVISVSSLRDRLGRDNSRYGDPTYTAPSVANLSIVDTRSGESIALFPRPAQATAFSWSPDASRLAFLLSDGNSWRIVIWERERRRMRNVDLPRDRIVTADASLQWSDDGSRLFFAMRRAAWQSEARQRFLDETEGPIVVQSSENPFLSWEEIRRLSLAQMPALLHVADGRVEELMPEAMLGSMTLTGDGAFLVYQEDVTEKTSYEEIFGSENRLIARPLAGGESRTLLESMKGVTLRWSGDSRAYVYAKEGSTWFGTVDGAEPRRLTGLDPVKPGEEPEDSAARAAERERREKERFTPIRLSHDGTWMVASNREGFWLIDTATGQERQNFLATPQAEEDDENSTAPRYGVVAWSRDGNEIYLSYASRTQWERGVLRLDRRTGELVELVMDARYYSGLRLSDDGSTFVLLIAEGNRPGDVFVADSDMGNIRRLTDVNPGIESKLARTELVKYLDVDGDELYGVLYYPLGYQAGTKVPTVFIVYEDFFDDRFNSMVNFLASNGFAVVQPSVDLERGFPGEAWMKGVTAAANRLIEMGVADPERLGVHGTSYGGYATNLLVTQTDRFAAAINISGKADMISFYFDSPRLGTRNIHAPERSQDRIGATLWEQPQKYIQHSAVMFADRVKTPLLLLTGREDHNVPERTTSEMFYALRRLGQRVEWVSYSDGGHGMPTSTEAEVRDFHARVLGWYDRYLKAAGTEKVTSN